MSADQLALLALVALDQVLRAHPGTTARPEQPALVDGRPVILQATLTRTGVVRGADGEPFLVGLHRVLVDPETFLLVPAVSASQIALTHARRRGRAHSTRTHKTRSAARRAGSKGLA